MTKPPGTAPPLPDASLLGRYLDHRDEAAFELLILRHGPMLMGLFHRMGLQTADAEDAFQATFFALARKAQAIGNRDSLASWLYKVAYRIAVEVRNRARVRHSREQALSGDEEARMEQDYAEFLAILDAEVMELPEKLRVPFVLCELQGSQLEQAARQIGCPVGTVGNRLFRAREMLRERMKRRGLILSPAVFAMFLGQQTALASPVPGLVQQALQLARGQGNGTIAPEVSPEVVSLSDQAVHGLVLAKLQLGLLILAGVLATLLLAVGVTVPFWAGESEPDTATRENWLALWGTIVDPEGDTQFMARPETLRVIVPPRAQMLLDPANHDAPRIVRDIRGDFLAEARTTLPTKGRLPEAFRRFRLQQGDANDILEQASFRAVGILVHQDADNFVEVLQGATRHADGPAVLTFRTRIQGKGKTETRAVPGVFAYLRLQRLGPHVFASGSPDGVRWGNFPAVTAEMNPSVRVGLIVEHNAEESFEATFSSYRTTRFDWNNNPQPPWKGKVAPPGCGKCHDGKTPVPRPTFHYPW